VSVVLSATVYYQVEVAKNVGLSRGISDSPLSFVHRSTLAIIYE